MRASWAIASLALAVPGATHAGDLEGALTRLQSDDVLVADRAVEEIVAEGEAGAEALLALVSDTRRDVRAGAIRGLGLLQDGRAVKPLQEALGASLDRSEPDTMEDRYFRVLEIQALGRIGDPSSAPLLRQVLDGGDAFERAHAGISLFLLGEDPGYDLVRDCLADSSMAIRNLAVEGAAEAGPEKARSLVLPMIEDASWVVRESAFRVLQTWPSDDEIRDALERGANDPSWYVRQTVAERR